MGNFSRDPEARLSDARGKHHVAVRLQQGVPILDADWNALDDLRRAEMEDIGRWSIGDGVPVGNDGFRIVPLAGGGIGTLVLRAKTIDVGPSSIEVDLGTSTAAGALGFFAGNAQAERRGSSPAQVTGNAFAPFTLAAGMTLAVRADGEAAEVVTFQAAGFANIAAATIAEVTAAVTAALTRTAASAGAGNDFIIRGGDGTDGGAGRLMVEGRMAVNERDLTYTGQALFENAALAAQWGVNPVAALTSSTDLVIVYLDLWHREVNADEDRELVDTRIGVETAVRLRREWAVRVVRAADFPALVAARPAGHAYSPLAQVKRGGAGATVDEAAIVDLRDTDTSLRRQVTYRGLLGQVQVDSAALFSLLTETRDVVRDFIAFLGIKFVSPSLAYVAGEVAGIDSLSAIAQVADQGLALLGARSLDTRGAIELMRQLRASELRFVSVWTAGVLPLVKATGKIYEIAFKETVDKVNALLIGPPPAGLVSLTDALARANLFDAVRTQRRINDELGEETSRPSGNLLLTYLGSPSPTVTRNLPLDLRYRVSGSVNPEDDLDVAMTLAAPWTFTLRNTDGSVPLALALGPASSPREFLVTVQVPNLAVATSDFTVAVNARRNPSALRFSTTPKQLVIGAAPPPSEQDFALNVALTNVSLGEGQFRVPTTFASADFTFRLFNNTGAAVTVNLEQEPASAPPWNIVKGGFSSTGQVIPAGGNRDFGYQFGPPSSAGQTLTFTFRARNAATSALLAAVTIVLRTI